MPTSTTVRPRGAALLALLSASSALLLTSSPCVAFHPHSSLSSSSSVIARGGRPSSAFLHPRRSTRSMPPISSSSSSSLSSASTDDVDWDPLVTAARDRLVSLSVDLSSKSAAGKVFVSSPCDAMKFRDEFVRFESLAASSAAAPSSSTSAQLLLGDWTLIATANLPPRGRGRKGDESVETTAKTKETPLDSLREAIKRSIGVIQRVRSVGESGIIDRVDNVIEFVPLETLDGILPEYFPFGSSSSSSLAPTLDKFLDFVNPLKLKKAKVVLVHKAEVESSMPVFRTKIAWTSSILNVAGTSGYLDPDGEDVFGLNNVLGEFLNVGYFDTPYVDDDVRLSRTSGPVSEQLRVFVREGSALLASLDSDAGGGVAVTDGALVGGDVDDAVVLEPRINDEVEEALKVTDEVDEALKGTVEGDEMLYGTNEGDEASIGTIETPSAAVETTSATVDDEVDDKKENEPPEE